MKRIWLSLVIMAGSALYSAAEQPGVKVMTYNLRYDNPADSLDDWRHRRDFMISLLRYHQPQILCTQESLIHQVRDLQAGLPGYTWCGVGRDDGQEAGEFSAIFYDTARFDLLATGTFWLSPTPDRPSRGWDAALNRICTWARLQDRMTDKKFCVLSTHFDHVGKTAREESARLILARVKEIAGKGPVILAGDFNSTPGEAPYAILTGPDGLQDAMAVSRTPHHGPVSTFSGFQVREGLNNERIDDIFVSPDIQVLKHATLTDFTEDLRFPSDHLPVTAELLLP